MSLSEKHRSELWSFANQLADRASKLLRSYHDSPSTEVEIKADGSPVTFADKQCELLLRRWIKERYPEHGIIGEEFGTDRGDAEFVWILDPIDGTKSFIRRVPLYGLLFGLIYQGNPHLGVIDQPVTRQRVIGDASGTCYNGQPVRVSTKRDLQDALLLTTDVKNIAKYQNAAAWERLVARTGIFRTWGDCYGHLMVAAGLGDIMADPVLCPWDLIPLLPVLRGAGATVSDWKGGDPLASGNIIAANPWLHEQTLAILNA
ncbi:MAG: inositol monophosphatase family protein [Puniceicoccales bacterium]|jgi:myo-inositol-1(or 4)-monophosphatase|nr:inositol monophosphatase family protein [Puniceicoccales bacterium]